MSQNPLFPFDPDDNPDLAYFHALATASYLLASTLRRIDPGREIVDDFLEQSLSVHGEIYRLPEEQRKLVVDTCKEVLDWAYRGRE